MERLLSEPSFGEAARAFAARHADYDPVTQAARLLARVRRTLIGRGTRRGEDAPRRAAAAHTPFSV